METESEKRDIGHPAGTGTVGGAVAEGGRRLRRDFFLLGLVLLAIFGAAGGFAYWSSSSRYVYIDEAVVSAPHIALSPPSSGILQQLFVGEGDEVAADAPVARVGDGIVKAKVAGRIIQLDDKLGTLVGAGDTVAAMVEDGALRVVGHLDENKGLADVRVGDPAFFTVDAFDGKQYSGVVDEVAPSSREQSVVFSISDTRPTNSFNVKIRFDAGKYPELKDGMSARVWILKSR